MYVIEQPVPPAPAADSAANVLAEWNAIYDAHNEVACLMLGRARKLKQGDLYLYVGTGVHAQVEAIGSFDLVLPNGLVICLDNFHSAPSIIRVSRNNVLYFNAIPSNGIYEIDMSNYVPNMLIYYNVSNKRVKHYLDATYLWHCRLAHISKKRIEKLQHDGLLKLTDDEFFDQCVSCLLGKMTRKSFLHHPERATDLLGIIHTDVCGPLKHVSRKDASYFITFTDDYSRYGYIYLLKHKHEVFETFKVFKNEVENQLGKTIKVLRSDRGGEYISQDFKDYLKACGIVKQRTLLILTIHNGVFVERRNRTLLDMVRSMMNLTTLPLSFWDYALESAARILNMVPTKKVDKTPYELWFGKVPNLSYLKVEGFKLPQEEEAPVRRSERPHRAHNRLCLNVEVEEHSLGDLNEPANYKAAMLDQESNKWLDAMNAEMQSICI
ncbi:retrotransposon protein, putative, ty1-copia subclass [Tanacetum coccineum]